MSEKKTVLITGVTGQDGSLLAEMYLARDYEVIGLKRRKANDDLGCLKYVTRRNDIQLVDGDVTDLGSLVKLCSKTKPHIFINTAAQSHVGVSFDLPDVTVASTGVGVTNCLEALRISGCAHHTHFLQLSTSEMFGGVGDSQGALSESSPMRPKSPYAVAKLFGYHMTQVYRDSYGMHASNSICFNHEEPFRRGEQFVTRKISMGVARIYDALDRMEEHIPKIKLGNLQARRDWGRAKDFCEAMMLIVDHDKPDDYVIATGKSHSIEDFLTEAFNVIGFDSWKAWVEHDENFKRPNEVHDLIGDSSKIRNVLGWKPTSTFQELVRDMVEADVLLEGGTRLLECLREEQLDNLVQPGLRIIGRA
jgi:GDPmannose 4,6-dehydratase